MRNFMGAWEAERAEKGKSAKKKNFELSLADWNTVCEEALKLKKELEQQGFKINVVVYKMDYERKFDIYFRVLDILGNTFASLSTDYCDSVSVYKKSFERIKKEILSL